MIWSRIVSPEAFSTAQFFFSSYGFYIKKFVAPFPLQLAIDTININMYAVAGLLLVLLFGIGMFFPSRGRYHFFYFWALLGLLPSAVVAFTDCADAVAERYLYLSLVPLAFISGMLCVELA
jgi:hypothetical protein